MYILVQKQLNEVLLRKLKLFVPEDGERQRNLIFTLLRPLPCFRTNFLVDSVGSIAIFERKTQTDYSLSELSVNKYLMSNEACSNWSICDCAP